MPFFDSWASLGRIALVGALAYIALVAALRVSGKRTLSKMSAFDLVVTVALGSTLATVLLSKDVALLDGIVAFVLLMVLQYIVARLSIASQTMERVVKSRPRLLFYDGQFLPEALVAERVLEDEVRAAVRSSGTLSLANVKAVVLETDGSLSVIGRSEGASESALEGVRRG